MIFSNEPGEAAQGLYKQILKAKSSLLLPLSLWLPAIACLSQDPMENANLSTLNVKYR